MVQNTCASTIPSTKELLCAMSYINSRSMYVYTYTGTYKKIEGLFWYPQVKLIWHNWDKSMQLNWYSKTINHHWTEAVIYHIFEILDNSTCMNVLSARSKLHKSHGKINIAFTYYTDTVYFSLNFWQPLVLG